MQMRNKQNNRCLNIKNSAKTYFAGECLHYLKKLSVIINFYFYFTILRFHLQQQQQQQQQQQKR